MAKSDTMLIAFPNGGLLPGEITCGDERAISAHEPVEVPTAYGQHLVDDRFAYKAKPTAPQKDDAAINRKKLEGQLAGLREKAEKAEGEHKAKLAEQIAGIVKQLADAS